jgi:hypothetical protein
MSEIDKFEGDLFWNDENPEDSVYSPEDELDDIGSLQIVEFQQAKRLSNFFGVAIPHDKDHDDYRFFTTQEEAEACVEAHKASAGVK